MKKFYQFAGVFFLTCIALVGYAQRNNVGIGTSQPDESAALEINSNNKGLLMPRMSLEQKNNIQNPAKGLIVYQTDMLSGFYYFDGKEWKPLTSATASNAVAGTDGDWALDGNASGANAATANSFIGTPAAVPINFRIGGVASGSITNLTMRNTFLGYQVGMSIQAAGVQNTAVGAEAFKSNTTGLRNVAFGRAALGANTTGGGNAAFGTNALASNTIGGNNMGIGFSSLALNTTGSDNIAIGANALFDNTTGINNIAIGSSAGSKKTGSGNVYIGFNAGSVATTTAENTRLYIANSNTVNPLIGGDFSKGFVRINVKPQVNATGGTTSPSSTLGFLAIGDFSDVNFSNASKVPVAGNGYRLYVQDGVMTEKVKVALKSTADWADYVFEPNYERMSLEKVEEFVKLNKHLPNVPSAEEMTKEGLDVTKTSAKLMEKIEELTLYMIELNKEVKALKAENATLKKALDK